MIMNLMCSHTAAELQCLFLQPHTDFIMSFLHSQMFYIPCLQMPGNKTNTYYFANHLQSQQGQRL